MSIIKCIIYIYGQDTAKEKAVTNFDFLLNTPDFASFADVAISAEKLLHIDVDACVLNCRRAMEFAVKWMFSVDSELDCRGEKSLYSLMREDEFKSLVGDDIWMRMDIVRKIGNAAAHGDKDITADEAEICLENLFVFLDFVAYCYTSDYNERDFDRSLLELTVDEALSFVPNASIDIDALMEENKSLREKLTARRAQHRQSYIPKPVDMSADKTRRIYDDYIQYDDAYRDDILSNGFRD